MSRFFMVHCVESHRVRGSKSHTKIYTNIHIQRYNSTDGQLYSSENYITVNCAMSMQTQTNISDILQTVKVLDMFTVTRHTEQRGGVIKNRSAVIYGS